MSGPTFQALANSLFWMSIAGNHAALVIGADHPPYTATDDEAIRHYGDDMDRYNTWVCWKIIMRETREVFDRLPSDVRDCCWEAFAKKRAELARKAHERSIETGAGS